VRLTIVNRKPIVLQLYNFMCIMAWLMADLSSRVQSLDLRWRCPPARGAELRRHLDQPLIVSTASIWQKNGSRSLNGDAVSAPPRAGSAWLSGRAPDSRPTAPQERP